MRQFDFIKICCILISFNAFGDCLNRFSELVLDYQKAEDLATLPFKCYNKESPHYQNETITIDHKVLTLYLQL
jgi:hypothetical protein